jgi:hypothetical protein
MPCELDALPRREVGEDFLLRFFEFVLDGLDLSGQVDLLLGRLFAEVFECLLQFDDRLFEFEGEDFHGDQSRIVTGVPMGRIV